MTDKAAGGEELMTTYRTNAPRLSGQAALGALGAVNYVFVLGTARVGIYRVFTERRRVFIHPPWINLIQLAVVAVDRLPDSHQEWGGV